MIPLRRSVTKKVTISWRPLWPPIWNKMIWITCRTSDFFSKMCLDKSVQTTMDSLWKNCSNADTVIECCVLPNSRNPAKVMALPLIRHHKATFLNTVCKSDHAPPAEVLLLPKCSGDLNVSQPKASGDQNRLQHQEGTFEIAKRFLQAVIFMKTIWVIYVMKCTWWLMTLSNQPLKLRIISVH